jgi:hypothetical protein
MCKKIAEEENTELTISSFPAWLRNMEVQESLFSTFCNRGMESSILGLEVPKGSPR